MESEDFADTNSTESERAPVESNAKPILRGAMKVREIGDALQIAGWDHHSPKPGLASLVQSVEVDIARIRRPGGVVDE